MNHRDMAVLAKGIAPVLRETVIRTAKPIVDRLKYLEARAPLQGDKGEPGRDGFSLSDFDVNVNEDGRTIVMSFGQGDQKFEVEMKFPVPLYRDVWKQGDYEAGDMVTWGGSMWIAQRNTSEKPDSPDSGWKLAVKRGRDGKDAK